MAQLTPAQTEAELELAKWGSPAAMYKLLAETMAGRAEIVTAANTIEASESGKVFFLNALAGFASTLPAPALGLHFKFIVALAPTSNGYTIVTNGSANIIVVSVNEVETDTTEDGPTDDDADLITFVHNVALRGDWLDVYSDGTSWYALGQARADGAITTGTT